MQYGKLSAGARLPDARGFVGGSGDDAHPVRTIRGTHDGAAVSAQNGKLSARARIPDACRLVFRCSNNAFAIRTVRDAIEATGMSAQNGHERGQHVCSPQGALCPFAGISENGPVCAGKPSKRVAGGALVVLVAGGLFGERCKRVGRPDGDALQKFGNTNAGEKHDGDCRADLNEDVALKPLRARDVLPVALDLVTLTFALGVLSRAGRLQILPFDQTERIGKVPRCEQPFRFLQAATAMREPTLHLTMRAPVPRGGTHAVER